MKALRYGALVLLGLTGAASSSIAGDSPAFSKAMDVHVTVNADKTATIDTTVRHKILKESAIRMLGEPTFSYSESTSAFEIREAFTEKADGRRIDVDPASILTRDAATGLNAVYQRDSKTKTAIFPDVEIGDSLVYVTRSHRFDKRLGENFVYSQLLSQSSPFVSYRLVVDVPTAVDLSVHVSGAGLTQTVSEDGVSRRHIITYEPSSWSTDEPGAVSAWDRDPQIIITTFKSQAEVGTAKWRLRQGKDVVTPEIQALADDITKGIDNRRAQAEAIDHWVKKNIRYVMVTIGTSGYTPNPASSVLKNKYGDCKDHAILVATLLKAKGISSEQVLINVGSSYRLAELPMPESNHAMLYLPEFGMYTDPTASSASFGVLYLDAYDKPVLHISDTGVRLAKNTGYEGRGSRHRDDNENGGRNRWLHHGRNTSTCHRDTRVDRSPDCRAH
jgi:transglutaminase-like putative cysteine protease